jgi:tetratricopeptide (TPR) repeat protein
LYDRLALDPAESYFKEAFGLSRAGGYRSEEALALAGLGDVSRARMDLTAADERYQSALMIATQLGEKGTIAQRQLAIAELRIEQNRFAEARSLAEKAFAVLKELEMRDEEARAVAVGSEALLAQGNLPVAKKRAEEAWQLAAHSQDLKVRVSVTLTAARVRTAAGEQAPATQLLARAEADVRGTGYAMLAFDIRLARGELESDPIQGRALLTAVEKDARAKGYGLAAARAERLLTRSQSQL